MKFMTITEVAETLQVHPITVYRWIAQGKLKATRPKGSRLVRITQKDLQRFLQTDRRAPARKLSVEPEDFTALPLGVGVWKRSDAYEE